MENNDSWTEKPKTQQIPEIQQKESRALSMFKNAIKSEYTKDGYSYWLGRYLKHTGKSSYDDLLLDDPKIIQKNLEDYIIELKAIHSRTTVKGIFYPIFLFYAMNDVILNITKLKKLFPSQEDQVGGVAYTDENVKTILESVKKPRLENPKLAKSNLKNLRLKALVHFFAASGTRLGAIERLTFYDISPLENCYAVKIHAGSMYEYVTFLTPEARRSLNDYLEFRTGKKFPEFLPEGTLSSHDRLYLKPDYKIFDMEYEALRIALNRLVKKANVSHRTESGRYNIPVIHGFRKRFNTVLKSNNAININAIERMMGHSLVRLDVAYYKPSIDQLFQEYEKGIEDLTIYKRKYAADFDEQHKN